MRKSRSCFLILVVLLMFGLLLFGESKHNAQASNGKYCGGESQNNVGLGLNLNLTCQDLYGGQAKAVSTKPDACGWVCRVQGQPDKGLDMQRACHRTYGNNAIATLVGIGVNDWRCLRPAEVNGHVVPVLLFPVEKLNIAEAPFVTAAMGRLNTLMGGIRRFYREWTSLPTRGTNAFVLLTGTTAKGWQDLAVCTDQNACSSRGNPAPFNRYGFHNRVKSELANGRWNVLVGNSSVRVGGFVTLGSSYPESPTWLGAASEGPYFSQPPLNSYAACGATTYENAFYGAGHEFGHTMGLPHTDQYRVQLPANWQQSIMYQGNGTQSLFFPFEVERLRSFLTNWQ